MEHASQTHPLCRELWLSGSFLFLSCSSQEVQDLCLNLLAGLLYLHDASLSRRSVVADMLPRLLAAASAESQVGG